MRNEQQVSRLQRKMVIDVKVIELKQVPAMVGWNHSDVVGEVLSLKHLTELPKLLKADLNCSMNTFYAGGMCVVLRFDIPADAKNFLSNDNSWNRWFKWVRMGVFDEPSLERIAWVKVTGVPISLRAEENYKAVTNPFGTTLQVDGDNWGNMDLSYGIACILTCCLTRINEFVTCSFNNKTYKVGVIEYDFNWHPFYHIPAPQDQHDDEDQNEE